MHPFSSTLPTVKIYWCVSLRNLWRARKLLQLQSSNHFPCPAQPAKEPVAKGKMMAKSNHKTTHLQAAEIWQIDANVGKNNSQSTTSSHVWTHRFSPADRAKPRQLATLYIYIFIYIYVIKLSIYIYEYNVF